MSYKQADQRIYWCCLVSSLYDWSSSPSILAAFVTSFAFDPQFIFSCLLPAIKKYPNPVLQQGWQFPKYIAIVKKQPSAFVTNLELRSRDKDTSINLPLIVCISSCLLAICLQLLSPHAQYSNRAATYYVMRSEFNFVMTCCFLK